MLRPDGAVTWVEMSVDRIDGGGAVGVLHDVTQQKLAQDELAKLSLVASYTDNLVLITDARGRTEWVNQAFTRRTGYTLPDIAGRPPGDVLQGPETDPETVERIGDQLREGVSFETEILNYTKAGEPYWVQIHITPVRDEHGAVERFVSIQTDSTELHRTQRELEVAMVRAEAANEAKTQFLATISHEMRTPLNAILGSAELAMTEDDVPRELQEHLARITSGAEVLLHLISDVLDVSRIEAGEIDVEQVPMDLRACLRDALAPLRPRAEAKGLVARPRPRPGAARGAARRRRPPAADRHESRRERREVHRRGTDLRRGGRRGGGARAVGGVRDQRRGHRHRHPA